MNLRTASACVLATIAMTAAAGAQDSAAVQRLLERAKESQPTVRTFTLKYMDPGDAAKLVTPYVDYTPAGAVYSAGSVRGITVRGSLAVLARVDSLLKANDREPESVTLSLQVIAAYDSVIHDPGVAGIEKDLHSVLRYAGYRSIAMGTVTAGEGPSETSLSSGRVQVFPITLSIVRIDPVGKSVRFYVSMRASAFSTGANGSTPVLSTGLTVPFGQSVVVGSGAPLRLPMGVGGDELAGQQALILVVRAEPAKRP